MTRRTRSRVARPTVAIAALGLAAGSLSMAAAPAHAAPAPHAAASAVASVRVPQGGLVVTEAAGGSHDAPVGPTTVAMYDTSGRRTVLATLGSVWMVDDVSNDGARILLRHRGGGAYARVLDLSTHRLGIVNGLYGGRFTNPSGLAIIAPGYVTDLTGHVRARISPVLATDGLPTPDGTRVVDARRSTVAVVSLATGRTVRTMALPPHDAQGCHLRHWTDATSFTISCSQGADAEVYRMSVSGARTVKLPGATDGTNDEWSTSTGTYLYTSEADETFTETGRLARRVGAGVSYLPGQVIPSEATANVVVGLLGTTAWTTGWNEENKQSITLHNLATMRSSVVHPATATSVVTALSMLDPKA